MSTKLDLSQRISRRFLPVTGDLRDRRPEDTSRSILTGRGLVLLSAWFGVSTGLLELLQLAVRNQLSGSVWLGVLRMNRHFGWMIPAANALLFLVAGMLVGLLGWISPRATRWLAPRFLGFLMALALVSTVRGLYPIAVFSVSAAIGHLLGRVFDAHGELAMGVLRRTLPLLLVLELGLTGYCSLPLIPRARHRQPVSSSAAGQRRPNVLLIVLDTVRAESLSLHGYGRDTSPNLVRLARRGVVFEQARATAPWTFPSHATMFTGRWPHELKVGENRPLDGTYPTLAERLSDLGYRTGGFVANTFFCNSWYGLARGFDRYEDFYDDDVAVSFTETLRSASLGQRLLTALGVPMADHRVRKDAARINRDFLDWMDREHDRPFFAFLNYFDAHSPYLLPDGAKRRLGTPDPDAAGLATLRSWEDRPRQKVSDRDTRLVRDAYDECIAYLDDHLGKLFNDLERRGVLEDTLVVITSDHGEQLGEHGLFGHGKSLYGQETRVPLLVLPPGGAQRQERVAEPASLRDLPATIIDVIGAGVGSPFPGASLAGYWNDVPSTAGSLSPAFSEVSLRLGASKNPNRPPAWRGPMQAVAAGQRSYIRNADGTEQLHNLQTDPMEEQSVAGDRAEQGTLDRLRRLLRSIMEPMSPLG